MDWLLLLFKLEYLSVVVGFFTSDVFLWLLAAIALDLMHLGEIGCWGMDVLNWPIFLLLLLSELSADLSLLVCINRYWQSRDLLCARV